MTSSYQRVVLGTGGAFLAYASVSLVWSPTEPLFPVARLALLAGAFAIGMRMRDLQQFWMWVNIALAANLALALIEYHLFGFDKAGYGLAGNPNYFGCALALGLAAAIAYRGWLAVAINIAGLGWCQSRGALFAGGVACLIGLWYSYRATGFIAMLLAILAMIVFKADLGMSLGARMGVWQVTTQHLTLWGTGFGSFQAAYTAWPVHINLIQIAPHAYNDFLELVLELGVGAIPLWLLIALCWEGRNWADRLVAVTFLVLSLTYFPFAILGPIFALTLGHLSQTREENPWLTEAALRRT
jgi:hypothetical protein